MSTRKKKRVKQQWLKFVEKEMKRYPFSHTTNSGSPALESDLNIAVEEVKVRNVS